MRTLAFYYTIKLARTLQTIKMIIDFYLKICYIYKISDSVLLFGNLIKKYKKI